MAGVKATVVWFRRDLRLTDNAAVAAAAADGAVIALFAVDPAFAASGAPRRAFMADALDALNRSTGGALVYRSGDPVDVVPAVAAAVGASSVIVAEDFGPYGRRRDAEVGRRLQRDGRSLRRVGSPYAVAPGSVRKDDGSPYAVFTPFHKRWVNQLGPGTESSSPPDVTWRRSPECGGEAPPLRPTPGCQLPQATEAAAAQLLDRLDPGGALHHYDSDRNFPARDGTSQLSGYLRWGIVHPNQMLGRLQPTRAHEVLRSELGWRDFYADVLATRPESAWNNLQPKMDHMPVDTDRAAHTRFVAWADGATGYPIVDAGMRQLLATGWMHNRVRMIVASFLVKDLHLPWQWGARHFLQHLVDGDLASNNHGWQWAAGTGTAAAPYFRIFNPVSQSQRFDPDGVYIRAWIPELAHISDKDIHAPWQAKRGVPLGYHPPLIDHATERAEALARYALVSRANR